MADFAMVKGWLQGLQLALVAEHPAEGLVIVDDEERGLKQLIVDCDDPMLVFTRQILPVPAQPGALLCRLPAGARSQASLCRRTARSSGTAAAGG